MLFTCVTMGTSTEIKACFFIIKYCMQYTDYSIYDMEQRTDYKLQNKVLLRNVLGLHF